MGATVAALTIMLWLFIAAFVAVIVQVLGLTAHLRYHVSRHQQSGFSLLLTVPAGLLGIFSIGFSLENVLVAVVLQAVFLVGVINLAIVAGRYWEYMVVSASGSTIRSGILHPADGRRRDRSQRVDDAGIYEICIEGWNRAWFRSYGFWTVDRWARGPSYARIRTRGGGIELRPKNARVITAEHTTTDVDRVQQVCDANGVEFALPEDMTGAQVRWKTIPYGREVALMQRSGERRCIVTTEPVPVIRQRIRDQIMRRTITGAVATLIALVPVMLLFGPG